MRSTLVRLLVIAFTACAAAVVFAASDDKPNKPAKPDVALEAPSNQAAAPPQTPSASSPSASSDDEDSDSDDADVRLRFRHRHHHNNGNGRVGFGKDTQLSSGEQADAVVSIGGSSTNNGEVSDAVVSIFGNTKVNGPVGDSAVAVFGDTYVNSKVDRDVVAVFGDVELGPQAEVGGDVVAVGGTLKRDPAAIVHGNVQEVSMPIGIGHMVWLRQWIKECVFLGRPLAFKPGLGWAWTVALSFLAFYVVLALLFNKGIERCARTFEEQPGKTVLASLITMILTPIGILLLCITVVGIALVPILGAALLLAGLFGKAVMLATIGRRVTTQFGESPVNHNAIAVLIGGVIVTLLYTVPIIGFLTYKILGILGLGVVIYTLLLAQRARRAPPVAPVSGSPSPTPDSTLDAGTPGIAAAETVATSSAEQPSAGAAPGAQAQAQAQAAAATTAPSPAMLLMMPRAGFWIRMLALFIDLVLVGVVLSVLHDSHKVELVALATYGAIMWKLKGTTIGGLACNLQVVRADGREIDWATAIVRALGCFLSMVVAGLGFIWIAIDSEKQAWHDKIAGTVVVRTSKAAALV